MRLRRVIVAGLVGLAAFAVAAPASGAVAPTSKTAGTDGTTVTTAASTATTPASTGAPSGVPSTESTASLSGAPVNPTIRDADNYLINPGFESGTTGWKLAGSSGAATNNPHTGSRLVYLDPGADNEVSQELAASAYPAPGQYLLQGWIATSGAGATFGIRDADGRVLAKVDIPSNKTYTSYEASVTVPDPAPAGLTVFVSGGKGWTNIDDLFLGADTRSLLGFSIDGAVTAPTLDADAHTVTLQFPYESDVSHLTAKATLPAGASIAPDPTVARDYSHPVTYAVTTAAGKRVDWTVTVAVGAPTITIDSTDRELVDAFNWATWKARTFVQTGKTGPINGSESSAPSGTATYMPSYWAGYADRTAFYSRDFAHQADGAHLLGLDLENKTMLQAFAGTANADRKWYPLWALNFDGSPFTVDYKSDTNFVREVPAVFELLQKADEQYRWTGDTAYLTDPTLLRYYDKAVTDFVSEHDSAIPNGIAEGTGKGIFSGAASYNERGDQPFIEAGDGIASQYAAYLAYADIAAARGEDKTAETWRAKAAQLRSYYDTTWSVPSSGSGYVRGLTDDGSSIVGFGREASAFIALKDLPDPASGSATGSAKDYATWVDEQYWADMPPNIEATTYLPDLLFNYGLNDRAWAWMQRTIDLRDQPHEHTSQGSNGNYPEVSFTLVSQTVQGLAGVQPDAPDHSVTTLSHLPSGIGDLTLHHIPLGSDKLGVRHVGATETTLTHESGTRPLTWTAQFVGNQDRITVNGKKVPVRHTSVNGQEVTTATVKVPVGKSVTAVAGTTAPTVSVSLPDPSASGWYLTTPTATLTAAAPAGASVAAVETRVKGAKGWGPWVRADGATTKVALAGEGTVSLEYRAITTSGVRSATGTTQVHVDLADPVVKITSPRAGRVITQGENVPFRFTCSDTGSGVASCVRGSGTRFASAGTAGGEANVAAAAGTAAPSAGRDLDTSHAGTLTAHVVAVDNAGRRVDRAVEYTVTAASGHRLATTGASPLPWAIAGGLLVCGGAVLLALRAVRRRLGRSFG